MQQEQERHPQKAIAVQRKSAQPERKCTIPCKQRRREVDMKKFGILAYDSSLNHAAVYKATLQAVLLVGSLTGILRCK